MALRVKVAQKEGAVGMVEFVMPQQASKKPSTPNLPVTYYSRISSVTGSFFREISQHAVNWLSTGTGGVEHRILWNQLKGFSAYPVLRGRGGGCRYKSVNICPSSVAGEY